MRAPAVVAGVLLLLPGAGLALEASFDVIYDEARDQACSATRGYPIKEAWIKELKELLPAFRRVWSSTAPALFAAAASITGRPTEAHAVPVTLTLCDTASQSFDGPSVNMRFALRSFANPSVPIRYKVDTAFHESLHSFTRLYVPKESKLLASHKRESACVLNHLHLLALQKAVLLAVGEAAALEQVIAVDSLLPSGCYKRAWALVNETPEAYQQYVAELRGEH